MQTVFQYERLKEARLKKNLTQEELAERCGSSDRYIRDLEKGRKVNPSADLVCQIASALDIPMEALFGAGQEEIL